MGHKQLWIWTVFFTGPLGCAESVESTADDLVAEAQLAATVCEGGSGQALFETSTFGGNGRTCASCHRSGTRTISPAEAQELFEQNPDDALFQGDATDGFGSAQPIEICTQVPSLDHACKVKKNGVKCRPKLVNLIAFECETSFHRFLAHATIAVGVTPATNVLVDGFNQTVFLNRGIPTTVNTPALDSVLMLDGRAPNLPEQAGGALSAHADVDDVCDANLAAIAAFEQTEFSRAELASFAGGGPAPELPAGTTASEQRGRIFFDQGIVPGPAPGGGGTGQPRGFCGMCHGGPMLDTMSARVSFPVVGPQSPGLEALPGDRFFSALVSETNQLGSAVHDWTIIEGGTVRTLASPDIGRGAITGIWQDANTFKIPTLWGVKDRAPFFHDNSSKTVEEVVDHYATFLGPLFTLTLTDQDKADIVAFLQLL